MTARFTWACGSFPAQMYARDICEQWKKNVQVQSDGAPDQLCQVGPDDGHLCQHIQHPQPHMQRRLVLWVPRLEPQKHLPGLMRERRRGDCTQPDGHRLQD